ncbi:MAG: hypothetical protein ACKOB8_13405 [Mycobacterium sp.]
MIRYLAVLAAGYVLGTKAGRARYEQIAGTYRALTGNPATRSMIEAGRRKIAERVSPDPVVVTITEIDTGIDRINSGVAQPERPA